MILPNPLLVYAAAGALLVGAIGGYKVRDWQCDASYAKALEKAEKQRQQMQAIIDKKAAAYEQQRAKADQVSVERTNTVREIYRNTPPPPAVCAPPPAAVRVLIESIGQSDTGDAAR